MRVVAVVSLGAGDHHYVVNCMRRLKRDGVYFFLIDDARCADAELVVNHVAGYDNCLGTSLSWPSTAFSLRRQLEQKQYVERRLSSFADWFLHLDIDEVLESDREGEKLAQAVGRVDREGYNVVDFDEYVFIPIEMEYRADCDSFEDLAHYYFFSPDQRRLMRAWKAGQGFSNVRSGGHEVEGDGVRIYPERFSLAHYIFRNQEHAYTKYTERRYDPNEVRRGQHRNRIGFSRESFTFPPRDRLRQRQSGRLDNGDRKSLHYWQWPSHGPTFGHRGVASYRGDLASA